MTTQPADLRVVIVGAGPAGMTAAHLLSQRGVDVNDPSIEVTTQLTPYGSSDIAGYYDGTLTFDTQVTTIDYTGDQIRLVDANNVTYEADRVIFTAPLKVLQRGDVTFVPELPAGRVEVIEDANVWSGLKVFLEFTEAFYPTILQTSDSETADGQRLYYDAAYGQETDANILGLFAVGEQAETYQALSDDELLDRILAELDEVFDGAATPTYVRHLVQNWNDEPFVGAAYLADVAPSSTSRRLSGSIDGRVFFAGDAYTSFNDWAASMPRHDRQQKPSTTFSAEPGH